MPHRRSCGVISWVILLAAYSTVGLAVMPDNPVRLASVFVATSARHPVLTFSDSSKLIFKPRYAVYLAAFTVRTLKHAGQQAALAFTLDSFDIDICYVSNTVATFGENMIFDVLEETGHDMYYGWRNKTEGHKSIVNYFIQIDPSEKLLIGGLIALVMRSVISASAYSRNIRDDWGTHNIGQSQRNLVETTVYFTYPEHTKNADPMSGYEFRISAMRERKCCFQTSIAPPDLEFLTSASVDRQSREGHKAAAHDESQLRGPNSACASVSFESSESYREFHRTTAKQQKNNNGIIEQSGLPVHSFELRY
ncbi:hypothetical protein CLF_106962 [Clonorchis sinensis]|uniref:Uncharacterized protein n=1 Tax=Clonorchis sinensis TaxID=79923 RepID=G7YG00_CLOSI|nr:hypothetical protein CLF_106962 [Clonorchis sinensis]